LTPGNLPGVVENVQIMSAQRDSTVTWSPVQGSSGYVVLVEWYVDSEVGPIPFVWARQVGAEATSFQYNREFTRVSVVAIGQGTAFTALNVVADVSP
jgi:hypothetical protein